MAGISGLPATQRLDLDLDPRVYLAGLALTVASALLIGMVPARQAWTGSPLQMIKNGLADPARRRFSLRDVLLVAQIAICALLVTASLVAVRGMRRALRWILRRHQAAGRDAGLDRPRRDWKGIGRSRSRRK